MFPSTQSALATALHSQVAADEIDNVEADKGEVSAFEVDELARPRSGEPRSRGGMGASMLRGPDRSLAIIKGSAAAVCALSLEHILDQHACGIHS